MKHPSIRILEGKKVFYIPCPKDVDDFYLMPITLRMANDFVACHHRHTGRTTSNGGRFAIGFAYNGVLFGCSIVGNPLSCTLMDGMTAEVLRLCVIEDSCPKGTCSQLYGASWRAWKAMGGRRMITYTLETEDGASLRGAGWRIVAKTKPSDWLHKKNQDKSKRTHSEVMNLIKNRWQIEIQEVKQ